MKRLITICCAASMVLAIAGLASAKSATKAKWEKGWISDSKCGVKGAAPGHEACGKKCLAAGEHAVFVNEHNKKVYTVDNEDAVKEMIGHRVAVHGTVDADKGSMHVDKVNPLPEKGKSASMGEMH